jgi:hypothetical protein
MNAGIFCQPIDQEYQVEDLDDRNEINFSDLGLLINFNPDFFEHEHEEIKKKASSESSFQQNILKNSSFKQNFQKLPDSFQSKENTHKFFGNFQQNLVTSVNLINPLPFIHKKSQTQKTKNRFRFKYILQPKWEETISKMKTNWFLAAKNKIRTTLEAYKTCNPNPHICKTQDNSHMNQIKSSQYLQNLDGERIKTSPVFFRFSNQETNLEKNISIYNNSIKKCENSPKYQNYPIFSSKK